MKNEHSIRWPAEWEAQHGVQLTWPHENSDWRGHVPEVEACFLNLAREISLREQVLIVCDDVVRVGETLRGTDVNPGRVTLAQAGSNDTWARDHAAITVYENGVPVLLDFAFNGWGLKYPAGHDNLITRALFKQGVFQGATLKTLGFVLEGGAIESDGNGTVLTTAQCLLSPNRNPHLRQDQIEAELSARLGATRFLWLHHGYLAGDDTDSHVDTLARFCAPDMIAYVGCDDPGDEHYAALKRMEEEVQSFRTVDGKPYTLIRLPMPGAKYDADGQRLPATYANFLIINDAVLVPTYNDPNDAVALERVRACFPGQTAVGIDCTSLILQHGALHCVTMQFPQGVRF